MKKLMVVLMIVVCGLNSAEAQTSIKVKLADNSPFNVAVDGRYFNKRGTSITVGDLPPGRHRVQIYSVMRNNRGRGREQVIFEGKVKTAEGTVAVLTYDPMTDRSDIQEMDMASFNASRPAVTGDGMNGYAGNNGYNGNNNGNNQGYNNNQNNQGYNNNQGGGNNNGYQQPPAPAQRPPATGSLNDTRIDQLKTNVAAKNTDTEKEKFLKDQVKDEKLTTDQVGTMMDWLNFESSKVEFAEWAYPITVDKDVFGSLEGKFTYKNYQDDLDNFLKTR